MIERQLARTRIYRLMYCYNYTILVCFSHVNDFYWCYLLAVYASVIFVVKRGLQYKDNFLFYLFRLYSIEKKSLLLFYLFKANKCVWCF